MRYGPVPADHGDELQVVRRQASGRVAVRAHLVLLSHRGCTVPQIAAIHDCGEEVVRIGRHRSEPHAVAGLEEEPRRGRPPTDRLAGPLVAAQASPSPPCSGQLQPGWSVAWLPAVLAQRFRLVRCWAAIRRSRHPMGWRWARPRLAPARTPDEGAQGKRTALEAATAPARHGLAHRRSREESDRPLVPLRRALGMQGQRRRLPTPGTNRRRAFCGALEAISGQGVSADHERQRAVHGVALLQRLAEASPTGTGSLALEQAATQTATVVGRGLAAHPRVPVRWLPKDAAHEGHPVERLSFLMQAAVAPDRLAGSSEELTAAARRFFADLAPHPVKLPSAA